MDKAHVFLGHGNRNRSRHLIHRSTYMILLVSTSVSVPSLQPQDLCQDAKLAHVKKFIPINQSCRRCWQCSLALKWCRQHKINELKHPSVYQTEGAMVMHPHINLCTSGHWLDFINHSV